MTRPGTGNGNRSADDGIGYEIVDGKVVLVPKNRSVLDLAGALYGPVRKAVSIEDVNESIAEAATERYERLRARR
ncbi:hypothetical protein [Chelativorans sp. M5D2P16]|uniref:hypothetical protein n=1 Tax=Chelativorans sp. M5D2P16 TaxID=3095678 RepID=UPI002ACAE4BB|nr:hypothetical protein [Chelativorans sp. M5D2P16]MDZ5699184.1 hypothetical protein [Chelativorans sp. M5D2P16]